MKTTIISLIHECPSCGRLDNISSTEYRLISNRFMAKESVICNNCGSEFVPTIHLNEFMQAGEEA